LLITRFRNQFHLISNPICSLMRLRNSDYTALPLYTVHIELTKTWQAYFHNSRTHLVISQSSIGAIFAINYFLPDYYISNGQVNEFGFSGEWSVPSAKLQVYISLLEWY
jgi:hypothetical protein